MAQDLSCVTDKDTFSCYWSRRFCTCIYKRQPLVPFQASWNYKLFQSKLTAEHLEVAVAAPWDMHWE